MTNEPINYLDSVLQEEELRWRMDEYGHDRRKYSISRSGRYKSINKKRDALKPELFKGVDPDKISCQSNSNSSNNNHYHHQPAQHQHQQQQSNFTRSRERDDKYNKYYETNL